MRELTDNITNYVGGYGVKVLRKQRWLFIWGVLALAVQFTWAAGHVHLHNASNGALGVAGFDKLHTANHLEHAHDEGPSTGVHNPSDHHPADHPDCPTCWTKALAGALTLPAFPVIALRRPLQHIARPSQTTALPTFPIPHGFHARAPPTRVS